MSEWQKAIKYLAMAFAVFLCVSIIGGICAGLAPVLYLVSGKSEKTVQEQPFAVTGQENTLFIEVGAAQLNIREGDAFHVDSNIKNLTVEEKNGSIEIVESASGFPFSSNARLDVVIPRGKVFEKVDITTGAGEVDIHALSAGTLYLELGAGEVEIDRLTVSSSAKIDGGAGSLSIENADIANLILNMGVGELDLTGRIRGRSELDMGIGESELTLFGSAEEYCITLNKGLGEASIAGKKVKDGTVFGTGENTLDVDGGVGEIRISFRQTGAA